MKKTICVVTGTRAEYGLLKPIMEKIRDDGNFILKIAATGSHLREEYGFTFREILNDGFEIDRRIEILTDESMRNVSFAQAAALRGVAEYFDADPPDMVVVLGDRYEILAATIAAYNAHIPVAHVHGGETTQGALDEAYRHCISKMAYLHFPSTAEYAKRIVQLGESGDRVFNVGALCLDTILHMQYASQNELEEKTGLLMDRPYAVVTFHPATMEKESAGRQMEELFCALDRFPELGILFTKSNADAGGQLINEMLEGYVKTRNNAVCHASLGQKYYYSVLKYCSAVIGNSSSGLLEAPAFKVPTVNIGDRQKGRVRTASVIDCRPVCADIAEAIRKALSPEMTGQMNNIVNPYGNGTASLQIAKVIKEFLYNNKIDLKKTFTDLNL